MIDTKQREMEHELEVLDGDPIGRIEKLTRILKAEAKDLAPGQVRFLVDAFYQVQEHRIATKNQVRSEDGANPIVAWLASNLEELEKQVGLVLSHYSKAHPVGKWMESICGIGSIIAAGYLAHIDITKAPTAGHIWSFAGLIPGVKWEKGQKRPWNAKLKVLTYKTSHSFVMQKGRDSSFYGQFYEDRKEYEAKLNESGAYKEQALAIATDKPKHKQVETYRGGRLPDGHIDMRARRWVVKLFLSHLHMVWYFNHYGKLPVKPYILEYPDKAEHIHVHMVDPPNMELIPGLVEAMEGAAA